uniref:ATP-binding cassette, subfamily B n=1 Tax=Candidatus Kentrum sp. UNK TaxID=2126344 RepID=A0A451ABT7_9GAMM|nr:MAG: ATP-binding cassette, subfamily B [Candidatus Kentron sp. UNK]VFK70839.1 MAG: ATP-binding cassette, subfamily B [Candidatus Kentron sp. UNK]
MSGERPDNIQPKRNWTKTNWLHAGAGLLVAKVATVSILGPVLGPAGLVLVGANYVSVATRGKGLLPNPFRNRPFRNSPFKKKYLSSAPSSDKKDQKALKRELITDKTPEGVGTKPTEQADNALFRIIKSIETPGQKHLRYRAMRYSLLSTALSYSTPLSMALIFTAIVTGGLPVLVKLGLRGIFAQLALLSGAVVSFAALESIASHRNTKVWKRYAAEIEHVLRTKTYAHIQQLDMAEQEKYGLNQMTELTHYNPVKIRSFLESVPNQTIDRVGSLLIGSFIIFLVVPITLLLILLLLPIPYFILRHYHDRLATSYRALGEADDRIGSQLLNSLSGLSVIKSFNAEAHENKRLTESSRTLGEKFVSANILNSKHMEACIFSYQVGITIPMLAGGVLLVLGDISITRFMVQSFMMGKLLAASNGMRHDFDLYRDANAVAHKLQEVFAKQATILSGNDALPTNGVQGAIEFDSVSFGYTDDKPVLKNIDLRIEPGQHIAFVGPTGSGKSTLIKLLLRFYEVQSGRVLLDEHDIRALDLESLRQAIGLVSQEVYLFPGSVHDNIRYGRPDSADEEVAAAAGTAQALEFIHQLPQGFDTKVSERGQNLSGGQRQRLSIARAMLKNPPILILDEATSAVDNETEALIQQSIIRASRGRSIVMIAHRLSTIRHADRIYVMQDGCITEAGSHDELFAKNGYYAQLWRLQTGENLLSPPNSDKQ